MNNGIAIFRNFGLSTPSRFVYNSEINAFTGNGYTSVAGNTYFNVARFAEGLIIKEDVGDGYLYSFLNGLYIYDIRSKCLLAERQYHCHYYSEETVKEEATRLLSELINEEARKQGRWINNNEVKRSIRRLLDRSFNNNQLEALGNHIRAISC